MFSFNPFTPEFLKWTLPSLNLDSSIVANRNKSKTFSNRIANSVDPDEMAHNEPSHLDLQFAKVSVLVCKADRVNNCHPPLCKRIHTKENIIFSWSGLPFKNFTSGPVSFEGYSFTINHFCSEVKFASCFGFYTLFVT